MKLKTSVFLWVFVATAVPITAITLYVTARSERGYMEQVRRQVDTGLGNVASEVSRRLLLERELLDGLASVPAVTGFIPVLEALAGGRTHPEYAARISRLERFLEDFQAIIPSMSTLRVLDIRGNTLTRVQSGRRVGARLSPDEPARLAPIEQNILGSDRFLAALEPGEFGYALLPEDREGTSVFEPAPVFDAVRAIGAEGGAVGYLVAKVRRGPIDRVLHVTPREHGGTLLIAEVNPDDPTRDGLLLFDDVSGLTLEGPRGEFLRVQDPYPQLYRRVLSHPNGVMDLPDGRTLLYYQEYMPYPDQLISWVIATRIDRERLAAPFRDIRIGTLAAAAMALLLSALLARLCAQGIARPVTELAQGLIAYAKGEPRRRVQVQGSEEIRHAGSAFNFMVDALEHTERERDEAQVAMLRSAKLAALGQMAAGIGHEVNNPLQNILSLTRLMERDLPGLAGEGLRLQDIASVREEALRASRVVKAVLNFARQVPPEYSRFHISSWLSECLALVGREAASRGVVLHSELDGLRWCAPPFFEGDRGLLQQALVNLLVNAIQASPRGAEVQLGAATTESGLEIVVQDQGSGIAEQDLSRVFDPFFTTKSVGEGSGLGLSISLGIVERHGGTLTVQNRSAGGVSARILLPSSVSEPATDYLSVTGSQ